MLSGNYTNTQNSDGYNLFIKCLTEFYKAAQSLNDKKFSEEDLRNVFNRGRLFQQTSCVPFDKEAAKEVFAQVVQSLSQPKVFDVEVEMEEKTTEDIQRELGIYGHDEGLNEAEYKDFAAKNSLIKPKITNGAIRILRVL